MIPVQQTKVGGPKDPPAERGDCWDACLASLLEVSIVEVGIVQGDDLHWFETSQQALKPHGYVAVDVGLDYYPHGYWIAAVPSLNLGPGVNHVIVMHDCEVVHDPALGDAYEVGKDVAFLDVKAAFVLSPLNPVSLKEKVTA